MIEEDIDTKGKTESPPDEVDASKLKKNVGSSLRWSLVDTALQQVLRFAVTIVLTRLVAPSEFGLIAMALVFVQLASLIGDLGLGPALVQRKVVEKIHITTATAATAIVGIVLAMLLAVASYSIAQFYKEPRLVPILQVLAFTYAMRGIAGVPRDLIRRAMRFDMFALCSGVSIGVSGAVALVMAFSGAGVWALVMQTLLESVLGALMATTVASRIKVWSPGFAMDRTVLRELMGFGVFVSGTRVVSYLASNVDNFIVGKVLGSLSLGLYNLAYRLMLFPILKIADVVASVTMPALSRIQDQRDTIVRAHNKTLVITFALCFPLSAGIAVVAPAIVPAVFGNRWTPAVLCVQVLAINGLRLALGRLNGSVFQAVGKPLWDFAINCLLVVLYVIGFVFAVHHGIVAVAIAFTIAGHLVLPLDFILLRKALQTPLHKVFSGTWPILVATVAMVVIGAGVMGFTSAMSPIPRSIVAVGLSAVVYCGLLFAMSPGIIRQFVSIVRRS